TCAASKSLLRFRHNYSIVAASKNPLARMEFLHVKTKPNGNSVHKHEQGINTLSVHGGDDRERAHQAIPMPIIQTATYAFADTQDLVNFMQHKTWGDGVDGREEYGRYGNPTIQSVERKVAALEGADDAVLFSSGMA